MKIIQVYDTRGGDNYRCGFSTRRAFDAFVTDSYAKHTAKWGDAHEILADGHGAAYLRGLGLTRVREVELPMVDDRYWNTSKLQVHLLMTEPYVMVDMDACLVGDLPATGDVVTEMLRPGGVFGLRCKQYGLRPSPMVVCSGLIGFRDVAFAHRYAARALQLIRNTKAREVDFEAMWTVEELLLTNMVEDEGLSVSEIDKGAYTHLQGKLK